MGFWDAVVSAGPYSTICISLQSDNYINTSSLNFYRPDALPDAQPIVSKHWRQTTNCTKIQKLGLKNCQGRLSGLGLKKAASFTEYFMQLI